MKRFKTLKTQVYLSESVVQREIGRGMAGGCLASFVDEGSAESHRYFLARRTVLEMLRDRGYAIAASDLDLTLSDFRSVYGDQPDPARLQYSTSLLSNTSDQVVVMFCGAESVKLTSINAIKDLVKGRGFSRMILIVRNNITSPARQATKDLFAYKVEIFKLTDLLSNIMKHVLMPKHEILTTEEKESLLKRYSVEEKQLPRMLESDAVAKYYGLEKGQVVKVTHDTGVTGTHVTYRCIM